MAIAVSKIYSKQGVKPYRYFIYSHASRCEISLFDWRLRRQGLEAFKPPAQARNGTWYQVWKLETAPALGLVKDFTERKAKMKGEKYLKRRANLIETLEANLKRDRRPMACRSLQPKEQGDTPYPHQETSRYEIRDKIPSTSYAERQAMCDAELASGDYGVIGRVYS
jgi:hypothetical protein